MRMFVFSLLLLTLFTGCVHKKPVTQNNLMKFQMTPVPLTPYHWQVEYDGGGSVQFNPDGSGDIVFQPKRPKTSGQTFATLLLLKDTLDRPLKNYAVKMEVTTVKQLREATPNEWEVFWFFGNYKKVQGANKTANYFLVKPNVGTELGRAFDETGQHFLKTSELGELQIGKRHTFVFVKEKQDVILFQDGKQILEYHGDQMPEALYDEAGSFGLYSEDALVRVHSFAYQAL